jgi:predicted dithiol-disulfide oxidoreductase (DUF899 family)
MTLIDGDLPAPAIVARDAWLREREALLEREKAHTREVDDPLLGPETEGAYVALLRRGERIFATNWITGRGVEAMKSSMAIADMTVHGRREAWEDSPTGWLQEPTFSAWSSDGRPTAQWSRPGARPHPRTITTDRQHRQHRREARQ